ncbi:hypothetical protein pipiens_008860 [Culex pipiens pipiens]|uniref:Uncharacterized protein n=1 Tax=Culex pipiens pipiens TaxID=38569 RepID=A0ABD1DFU9_CULPP
MLLNNALRTSSFLPDSVKTYEGVCRTFPDHVLTFAITVRGVSGYNLSTQRLLPRLPNDVLDSSTQAADLGLGLLHAGGLKHTGLQTSKGHARSKELNEKDCSFFINKHVEHR